MHTINNFKKMWNKSNRISIVPMTFSNWTKVLRLGPVPRISAEKFIEVKLWRLNFKLKINKIFLIVISF